MPGHGVKYRGSTPSWYGLSGICEPYPFILDDGTNYLRKMVIDTHDFSKLYCSKFFNFCGGGLSIANSKDKDNQIDPFLIHTSLIPKSQTLIDFLNKQNRVIMQSQ